jgi:hypothetical protein
MGIAVSLALMAVGGILTWGVTDTSAGINIAAVGVILMLVGLLGLALSLAFWSSFSPFASSAPFRRTASAAPGYADDVVVQRAPLQNRTVVVHDQPPTVIHEEAAPRERIVVVHEPDDTVR